MFHATNNVESIMAGDVKIQGHSLGGMSTSIIVPQYKAVFDIGRCPQRACFHETVFITHGHLDHVGGVAFHASTRNLHELSPSHFIVPKGMKLNLENYLHASEILNGTDFPFNITELKLGDVIKLPNKMIVRSFPTIHPVKSQIKIKGYVLYSIKEKLKSEFKDKTGEELKQLKLKGTEITYKIEEPEIAFTGDTTMEFANLETSSDALSAKILITELSNFTDVSLEKAKQYGHAHILDFLKYQEKFKNKWIVLTHFSPRYKRSDIEEQLKIHLTDELKTKCIPLLSEFPL